MAKYFYARVSTADGKQDHERQLYLLGQSGHKVDKIYTEKMTGTKIDRPVWQECYGSLQRGDTLVVSELARISRSTIDALTVINELNEKGVELVSLKEQLDTTTPHGKFFITMIAAMAEMERANIVQRVRDGVSAAQARGVKFGRSKDEKKRAMIRAEVIDPQWHGSVARTARELAVNPRTVNRVLGELGAATESL